MGLRREIIDLIRTDLTNQRMRIARVRQIAVVEKKPPVILRISQEMIDPLRA